jgi:membrane fusion protein (multidrug efflux system)
MDQQEEIAMDTLMEELEQTAVATPERSRKATPRPRGNAKARLLIAGALVVAVAAGAGSYAYFHGRVSTDDAQVDAHIAPIAPRISGSVAEILVDDNQAVKAGQVLLKIDPRDYQAKVDQARATLAAAESQAVGAREGVPLTNATTASGTSAAEAQLAAANSDYDRAKADYERASSSELAYARADVEAKRATADRAQADLARMQPLASKDEISKLQLDAYVAATRVADSDLTASEQKLANAGKQAEGSQAGMQAAFAHVAAARAALAQAQANRQQVSISTAQAGTASATILQARANLEAAQLELSYTTLIAPIGGVVTKKAVQLGQIVQPGQSLLTIVPLQEVWVTANFKETQLSGTRPGQRAEIHVDMYGRSFEGHVDSVAGATGARLSLLPPENATGNYVKIVQRIPVKIVLNEIPAGFVFRPGMNVDATIITK